MGYYRMVGDVPRKRHQQFRNDDGSLLAEELMGSQGFSGESVLLYHRYLPTTIESADVVEPVGVQWEAKANVPLLPRHFRTHALDAGGDVVTGRRVLLANQDLEISYVAATEESELYRNALGDECVYIEAGSARLETVFGVIEVGTGDYVVIPMSTTHRWVPTGQRPLRALVVEARSHVSLPARYLSARGQLLEEAPFSERDLRGPEGPLVVEGEDVAVLVRHRGGWTRYRYAHHPFDVVGWDGCWYPYALSINDFEPIVKRFHAPPPVHQTFEGAGFVICSFCPRPFDFDPEAVSVSYNHTNADCDEVLFYVHGNFMSRTGSGIEEGSISLHPAGFIHGPQPGSVEAALGQPGTDELAVMIDAFRPLDLGPLAGRCEDPEYAWSWVRRA